MQFIYKEIAAVAHDCFELVSRCLSVLVHEKEYDWFSKQIYGNFRDWQNADAFFCPEGWQNTSAILYLPYAVESGCFCVFYIFLRLLETCIYLYVERVIVLADCGSPGIRESIISLENQILA